MHLCVRVVPFLFKKCFPYMYLSSISSKQLTWPPNHIKKLYFPRSQIGIKTGCSVKWTSETVEKYLRIRGRPILFV